MIEYEYSFKVKDISKYINYCINNNFTLEKEIKEIRHLYKKDNTLARITQTESEVILDFKDDNSIDKVYKEAKESSKEITTLENAKQKVLALGFIKFNDLERTRTIYFKDDIKYEIDEYLRPEKCFVVAIEGNKEKIKKEYLHHCNYYRFTYEGIGIYEAVRQTVDQNTWKEILKNESITWLPKPNIYENQNRSYFTKKGYNNFLEKVKPIFSKYIDFNKVKEDAFPEVDNIIYQDEYQVITK